MSTKDATYGLNKPVCEYCHKYNGDHFDDEYERYDYYSCELKNNYDTEKYRYYGSKDNEVFKEDCLYPGCPSCAYKEILEKRLEEIKK